MSVKFTMSKPGLICFKDGCDCKIEQVHLGIKTDNIPGELKYTCYAGHTTVMQLDVTDRSVRDAQKTRPEKVEIFTKVSGVTFCNVDGTNRQDLLRHVQAGDHLDIEVRHIDKDKKAYAVKHALGIIGVLKLDVIKDVAEQHPGRALIGKVRRVTGGEGEKATLGCNIEITLDPDFGADKKPLVYMEEGSDVFHINSTCSGLKNPPILSMTDAKTIKKARACKKCAAQYD